MFEIRIQTGFSRCDDAISALGEPCRSAPMRLMQPSPEGRSMQWVLCGVRNREGEDRTGRLSHWTSRHDSKPTTGYIRPRFRSVRIFPGERQGSPLSSDNPSSQEGSSLSLRDARSISDFSAATLCLNSSGVSARSAWGTSNGPLDGCCMAHPPPASAVGMCCSGALDLLHRAWSSFPAYRYPQSDCPSRVGSVEPRPCTRPEDRTSSAKAAKSRGTRATRSRSGISRVFPSLDYSHRQHCLRSTYFRWDLHGREIRAAWSRSAMKLLRRSGPRLTATKARSHLIFNRGDRLYYISAEFVVLIPY